MAHKIAFSERQRQKDVRMTNIVSAKAVADAVRTSLGPRGMDKMIQNSQGEVIITNDGATILKKMELMQPAAKMLQSLSRSQDIEAGDGTTSVVVLAGALLSAVDKLLDKGIHATRISEAFKKAANKADEILEKVALPVDLDDRQSLIACTETSLSSKVVSVHSEVFSPLAVDAVLKVADKAKNFVDLNDIRIVKSVGGTIDETQLVDGLVLSNRLLSKQKAGKKITRVENAKVGLIQFCLSPPKTDMDNEIVVHDNAAIDRILKEERKYIISLIKKIKKSGCNVLLIQKSILRDAVNDLTLHYLGKAKIVAVTDIERRDVEFIANTLGLQPVAHIDHFKPEYLGNVGLVEQVRGEEKKEEERKRREGEGNMDRKKGKIS